MKRLHEINDPKKFEAAFYGRHGVPPSSVAPVKRKKRKPREKIVASAVDIELASELLNGRELRAFDYGELQAIRKEAAIQNADALKSKREGGGHVYGSAIEWHAATLAFLRRVDAELTRERAFRKRQFVLAL